MIENEPSLPDLGRGAGGRRSNPGDVANAVVRCLLADASALLGSWGPPEQEQTLARFRGRCVYTGTPLVNGPWAWDHLVPHNRDACGLHVLGNLVPATKDANAAKGDRDFREFLRHEQACLAHLSPAEREARIRDLEAFQHETSYVELAAASEELRSLCAEQYERAKSMCRENKDHLQQRFGESRRHSAAIVRTPHARDGVLPIEYEVQPPARFLQHLLAAGMAYIEEHYADGRVLVKNYPAGRLTPTSNLVGNIRSKPEYRQGFWQSAGIVKLVLRLNREVKHRATGPS